MSETKDYKSTLNLPGTDFPMKANLPRREPEQLKEWEAQDLYNRVIENNIKKTRYIHHDGPPYANGEIHMGTALNKVLKDMVVRYKNMTGFCAPYVPGWDCHGLPIELQVEKKYGKAPDALETIKRCRAYASEYIEKQKQTFKRLGVYGDWDHPYLTMNYKYEADIIREFAKIVEKDAVYRADKPVYWCSSCTTALAEAEVEYKDHKSASIYVKFRACDDLVSKLGVQRGQGDVYVVIWTTTPWTLPANLAISVHPDFVYGAYRNKTNGQTWIMGEELFENFIKDTGFSASDFEKVKSFKGSEMEKTNAEHPFFDRKSLVLSGTHVTTEAGTGCVHTAPGHGVEDYIICKEYGIEAYNPVDDNGAFYPDLPLFGGMNVNDGNRAIVEHLDKSGHLIKMAMVKHSYPHCWRCKKPILFRATPQWFISMDKTGLRKKTLSEIEKVKWTPERGMNRIYSMVENRPDWCISRQRIWGVPIIYFQCSKCGHAILDTGLIRKIADMVEKNGIEIWHSSDVSEILPKGTKCASCKSEEFKKSRDILDVWFDSGVSHAAVCQQNKMLGWPADLYFEGSDQHRGWFHTSILTSVLTTGEAPYKQVVTHGFIVDKDGYKMSKSMGNVVDPMDLVKKSGADILRLWVAHENFIDDISYSDESYSRVTEAYRRIRNTWRFILGNLSDFDPAGHSVEYSKLREVDKWMAHKLNMLLKNVRDAYESFEFYKIFQLVHNFCVVELSSFYMDIAKDTLYTDKKDSYERRCLQTMLYSSVDVLIKILAPVIPFTAEEAWAFMPANKKGSIHFESIPEVKSDQINRQLEDKWQKILELRENILKAAEQKRKDKIIGHSLDATVKLGLPEELYEILASIGIAPDLLFIVSNVELYKSSDLEIEITKSVYAKCARCWQYKPEVGSLANKELCKRCSSAIE
ncbi:MAG: isoleucine--tRNA ligase [Oligoflexia bacterium]|nr:isoleucine--tRNA ligase [Oligoflexia bacterium]